METLKFANVSTSSTEQDIERAHRKKEYLLECQKRKNKFLFWERIEKKAGRMVLIMTGVLFAFYACLFPLYFFELVDISSKVIEGIVVMLAWVLGVSAVVWFVCALFRSHFDDTPDYDVYPNLGR